MKDYYKILGVEEEASEEEIRTRWIELTKHYHPDLGQTEEGDEKIREINEAYEILKDDRSRFNYDFERDLKRSFIKKGHQQHERRMNILKKIVIPCSGILVLFLIAGFLLFRRAEVGTAPRTGAKTDALSKMGKISEKETASHIPPVRKDSKAQEEMRAQEEIKKEVVPPESKKMVSLPPGLSPSAADRESDRKKEPPRKILPESKVPARVEKETPKEIPQEGTRVASAPLPPPAKKESESREKLAPQGVTKSEMPAMKEVSKEVPREVPKQVAKEVPKEVSKEVSKEVAKEVPKEAPKEVPKETPKEVPKETPKEVPKEVLKEIPKEVSQEVPKEIPKQIAKEVSKELPQEVPRVTLHPGEKLTMWTKEERGATSRPSLLAEEEEVEQFFSNYADRYHRKDINGFLSFFSSRAVHNQKEGFEGIRSIYTKFFDESKALQFQVEGMKTEIYQNRAEVKARFRVAQTLKKASQEKVWKGDIRWVLVKEEGRLKIVSLDYQNDKSP